MAPKQDDMIKNPPTASSSEEEEEESGSSGEESESSSDEVDAQSNLTQTSVVPVAAKKPESESEEEDESESESDSDSESAEDKKKSLETVVAKPKPENSVSAVKPQESSTAKRPLKQADDEPKKKIKISATEHVKKPATTDEEVKKISGDEAKKMFQRVFSETDEIAMLQGYLDFTSTRGDPSENMDAFCEYVKTLIDFDATRTQIVTKLQRCKKKFVNLVKNSLKKGTTEDKIKCSKDLDQKAFELSRKIWGINGVLPAKSRNISKETKSLPSTPKKVKETENIKANVVDTHLSASREIASFFMEENANVLGLDVASVSARWDMVADGPKKKEMEEKLKKLKERQRELSLQRIGLVDNSAEMIL